MSDHSRIQQAAEYIAKQYEARQPIDIMAVMNSFPEFLVNRSKTAESEPGSRWRLQNRLDQSGVATAHRRQRALRVGGFRPPDCQCAGHVQQRQL